MCTPDGYVKIKDRSKDIIISGGENISSVEVEDALYRHPAVLAVAVVAQPDAKWGETPCAFVELKDGASATAEDLIAHCRTLLAGLQGAQGGVLRAAAQDLDGQDPEVRNCARRSSRIRRSTCRASDEAVRCANAVCNDGYYLSPHGGGGGLAGEPREAKPVDISSMARLRSLWEFGPYPIPNGLAAMPHSPPGHARPDVMLHNVLKPK
ncbi:AMP-binding enzyme [Cupriavidus basilensis]